MTSFAQTDSLVNKAIDNEGIRADSVQIADTSELKNKRRLTVNIQDRVQDPVDYGSRDSSELDMTNEIVRLWGEAYVRYQRMDIKANYIEIDFKKDIIKAEVGTGADGRPVGKPDVHLEGQQIVANKIKFNYKLKKGYIIDTRAKQSDLYINSKQAKVIAGPNDSLKSDDVIFQKDALITTCNYPDAHFGIHTTKAKFIPDKVGVIGPAYLEVAGVPTPFVLPFGFFPLTKGKQTGILFPNNYTFSPQWGYGLQNIGYYFPISDQLDFVVRGDIYLRGSHRVELQTRYVKRYKFSTTVNLEYSTQYTEIPNSYKIASKTSYSIIATLNQSPKANPTIQFGGTVNLQLGRHKELNYNDANSVLNNLMSSNISLSKSFPGKPYSLTAQFSHSQNTVTRDFSITLPNVNFQTQSIFPFKSKKRVGKDKWYDQISFTYAAKFKNSFNTKDSLLFTRQTLKSSKQGMDQNISVSSSYRVLKYFNLTPSFSYNERWGFNTINERFNPEILYRQDTIYNTDSTEVLRIDSTIIRDGYVQKDTLNKFHAFRTYNASLSMNTQIFGLLRFRKGWFRAIRHQLRPSIGFNFAPDYSGYFNQIQQSNNPTVPYAIYSPYSENTFGGPSYAGQQMGISISLNNTIEAKFRNKRDTVDKKVKIFDNLYVNTFYNIIADSFKMQPLTYGATTRLFKGLSVLTFSGQFDFYKSRANKSYDTYIYKTDKKLLKFVRFNASLNTGISIREIRQLINGETRDPKKTVGNEGKGRTFTSLFDDFRINHTINVTVLDHPVNGKKWNVNTNSINMTGSLPLTDKWSIAVGFIGYDFNRKQIVYPDLGFLRDLHCWEMGLSWQPERGTYTFFIRVKPGSLDFIKIPRNKNRADALIDF